MFVMRFCTSVGKIFVLFPTAFLKCFIWNRIGMLDSLWCNNSYLAYKELGQGNFYEEAPFTLSHLHSTAEKCNHKENNAYLNLVYSICHRVNIYRLVKLLTSFFCYDFYLVSSLPSTTTLRFSHFSSMNIISPGKSTKFPIPSTIIPSSSLMKI